MVRLKIFWILLIGSLLFINFSRSQTEKIEPEEGSGNEYSDDEYEEYSDEDYEEGGEEDGEEEETEENDDLDDEEEEYEDDDDDDDDEEEEEDEDGDQKNSSGFNESDNRNGDHHDYNINNLDPHDNFNQKKNNNNEFREHPEENTDSQYIENKFYTNNQGQIDLEQNGQSKETDISLTPKTSRDFSHILIFALIIGGSLLTLLLVIMLIMFLVYRMRKKDQGSYALDENLKKKSIIYTKAPSTTNEFFA